MLVRTSNPGAGDFQDLQVGGAPVWRRVAEMLAPECARLRGASGWSGLMAVAGATYPEEARALREAMPEALFLVPGYGAQGASAADAVAGFVTKAKGREGGVVSSSRAVLYPQAAQAAKTHGRMARGDRRRHGRRGSRTTRRLYVADTRQTNAELAKPLDSGMRARNRASEGETHAQEPRRAPCWPRSRCSSPRRLIADGPGDAGPNVAAPPVRAAPVQPPPTPTPRRKGRTGVIPLGNDGLSLNVPAGYRFYSAEEAHAYLQRANAARAERRRSTACSRARAKTSARPARGPR